MFAPLNVLFDSQGSDEDIVVPVRILKGGELQKTDNTQPDLVLTFHAVESTITFAICFVKPEVEDNLRITMSALYGMVASNPLTVEQFQRLYTVVSHRVMRDHSLQTPRIRIPPTV